MKKDFARGEGTRLAPGGALFNAEGDSHVQRVTPMQTKRREIENGSRYRTKDAPDTSKEREQRTTALRRKKDVRPL